MLALTIPLTDILDALAGGNNLVAAAQNARIMKNKAWRQVYVALKSGKKVAGPALVVSIPSEQPLVDIAALDASDTMILCQAIHHDRTYRSVYKRLFSGRV